MDIKQYDLVEITEIGADSAWSGNAEWLVGQQVSPSDIEDVVDGFYQGYVTVIDREGDEHNIYCNALGLKPVGEDENSEWTLITDFEELVKGRSYLIENADRTPLCDEPGLEWVFLNIDCDGDAKVYNEDWGHTHLWLHRMMYDGGYYVKLVESAKEIEVGSTVTLTDIHSADAYSNMPQLIGQKFQVDELISGSKPPAGYISACLTSLETGYSHTFFAVQIAPVEGDVVTTDSASTQEPPEGYVVLTDYHMLTSGHGYLILNHDLTPFEDMRDHVWSFEQVDDDGDAIMCSHSQGEEFLWDYKITDGEFYYVKPLTEGDLLLPTTSPAYTEADKIQIQSYGELTVGNEYLIWCKVFASCYQEDPLKTVWVYDGDCCFTSVRTELIDRLTGTSQICFNPEHLSVIPLTPSDPLLQENVPEETPEVVEEDTYASGLGALTYCRETEPVEAQNHYVSSEIQPIDFITRNNLDFLEGNVIKYVSRYKLKNGIEDLEKAKVYLDWLIQRELFGKIYHA